jgi:hypothetical protein
MKVTLIKGFISEAMAEKIVRYLIRVYMPKWHLSKNPIRQKGERHE